MNKSRDAHMHKHRDIDTHKSKEKISNTSIDKDIHNRIKDIHQQIKQLKHSKNFHGRIGVYALDTNNNKSFSHRENERFSFVSTCKVIVAAAILKKSETDKTILNKHINYTKEDVEKIDWTPITKLHIVDGMSIEELAMASVSYSDSFAMNLLVEHLICESICSLDKR